MDDHRIEAILRDHIKLTQAKWDEHKLTDLWVSAEDAVNAGMADGFGEFSPPVGTQMFYVGAP
jgi:hypothetical protein